MQTYGFFIDKRTGKKILVLKRLGKRIDKFNHIIDLKIRKSGSDGINIFEADYLNQNPELIDKLKNGEVVYC